MSDQIWIIYHTTKKYVNSINTKQRVPFFMTFHFLVCIDKTHQILSFIYSHLKNIHILTFPISNWKITRTLIHSSSDTLLTGFTYVCTYSYTDLLIHTHTLTRAPSDTFYFYFFSMYICIRYTCRQHKTKNPCDFSYNCNRECFRYVFCVYLVYTTDVNVSASSKRELKRKRYTKNKMS